MLCPAHLASIEDVSVSGRLVDFLFPRLVVFGRSRASGEGEVLTSLRSLAEGRMLVVCFVAVQLLVRRAGRAASGSNGHTINGIDGFRRRRGRRKHNLGKLMVSCS